MSLAEQDAMSVLHGSSETPAEDSCAPGSPSIPLRGVAIYKPRPCPECMAHFQPVHPRQLFCSEAHKRAFNNRWTVRGRALAVIATAARITRGGNRGDRQTGRTARREAERMMSRFAQEDRDAGRMSAVDYMRDRQKIGY